VKEDNFLNLIHNNINLIKQLLRYLFYFLKKILVYTHILKINIVEKAQQKKLR